MALISRPLTGLGKAAQKKMMRILKEDTYHLIQLHLSETVSKTPRNYFYINKVAVVDKWSMWWKEIVVSVNGGYWRRAVTEIKMR